MPSIKLDGKEIPFEQGDTIITAAWKQGVEIPHYCWHPGLSIAANCRMCLVEIDPMPNRRQLVLDVLQWDPKKGDYVPGRKPKLEPACQAECMDGMNVKSESSPHVRDARKHVQEFLLLNHPVDCPICDQAGECKLQDYWLTDQRAPKRMLDEVIHKPKAVEFGDTIVYDAERCIVCTRCVRFMEEVALDPVLDKRERGNLGEIVVSPGRKLEGHYTMMTDHVCPVGALTTKDFRFKARVWFLRKAPTICPGCATGCNAWLDYDPRTGEVPRLRPRDNLQVNKFWMCDDGILTHRRAQIDRVTHGYVGRGGERRAVRPGAALEAAAKLLEGKVAVVFSAQHSSEDNFALAQLAKALGATDFYLSRLNDWDGDKILRDADHNPNVRGATAAAGGSPKKLEELTGASTILALGGIADIDQATLAVLGRSKIVAIAANHGPLTNVADVLLPAASWSESDGTFVNRQGIEQPFEAGPRPAGDSLPAWDVIARLARALGHNLAFNKLRDVRAAMDARSNQNPAAAAPPPAPAQ
ncbi:MAG: (2Fe-2S)-binding protein [Deltaproteobacteria bacterium]|nr:(2Fe-2S)-binding protein [Deltaproteobacteria bacterium]